MNGIVTDIQRFSIHDGPGIRTTVFLKGCNLRCWWCHNPETLHPGPELRSLPSRCIGCGACLEACKWGVHVMRDGQRLFRRERCVACGLCTRTCYAGALVLVGRKTSAEDVLAEVLEDEPFYNDSGGGVTISGGEPLFQAEFTGEVLRLCKERGIHTAIETNLAWPWEHVASVLPFTDLVMLDIKTLDSLHHQEATGAPNTQVLENARRLSREDKPLIVRTPVVPGFNDAPEDIEAIAEFVMRLSGLEYYELLPYHPLGEDKYRSLGLEYRLNGLKPPPRERMRDLADAARRRGVPVRVPGEKSA